MEFVIFCNKYGLRIRKIFDEFHTFFETKGKAGSAESISIYGFSDRIVTDTSELS